MLHRTTTRSARPRWTRLAAAVAALAITAAACGGDDDDATETDGSAATATTTAGSDDRRQLHARLPAVRRRAPRPRRTGPPTPAARCSYAYPIGPSRFDPHRSTVGQDIRIFTLVYDRLVHYDSSGHADPGPRRVLGVLRRRAAADDEAARGRHVPGRHPVRRRGREGQHRAGPDRRGLRRRRRPRDISEVQVVDPTRSSSCSRRPTRRCPASCPAAPGSWSARPRSATASTSPRSAPARTGSPTTCPTTAIIFEKFEDYWDTTYGGPDTRRVADHPRRDDPPQRPPGRRGRRRPDHGCPAAGRRDGRPHGRPAPDAELPDDLPEPDEGRVRQHPGAPGDEPRHRPRGVRRGRARRRRRADGAGLPGGLLRPQPGLPGGLLRVRPGEGQGAARRGRRTRTASRSTCSCRTCRRYSSAPRCTQQMLADVGITRDAGAASTPPRRATSCSPRTPATP